MAVADDLELLTRWREGDDEAGEVLIRAHYAAVFEQIRGKVNGDADLASELTQRVFEVLLHKRDTIVSHVGAYLGGIARRKVIEHYRARRPTLENELSQIPVSGDGASTLLSRREDVALLAQALRSLPEDDQRLLLWAYADGLTQRAIGERLGLSKQQVNGRIDRVRDKLRQRLDELAESSEQRASVAAGFETWVISLRRRLEG
jgi:RNA polymerase sigma factor (sigma-70 family)